MASFSGKPSSKHDLLMTAHMQTCSTSFACAPSLAGGAPCYRDNLVGLCLGSTDTGVLTHIHFIPHGCCFLVTIEQ